VRFGKLVIATGSRPRRLAALPLGERVRELRTLEDATALRAALVGGGRLVIVGAGLVGMEVACSACALGIEVTLIEAAATPLARALPPQLGLWLVGLQLCAGVEVRLGTSVRAAVQRKADVRLELSDGGRLRAGAVLVATGTAPASEWLANSPLGSGAVATDAGGRTSFADIYAAGDVACAEDPLTGERQAAQHWEAAARGGADVARSIVGLAPAPAPPAMFWSDQHGRRVHVIGSAPVGCAVEIEADPDGRGFTAWLSDRGVLRGAMLVDRPGCLAQARARVGAARPVVKGPRIAA
jgi:3-phenylpropionate/trans-cinnamate dioxygenase ferredoxin reductase subunit